MKPQELEYASLTKLLQPFAKKDRSESAAFLNWFLENVFRLDDVSADDAICDNSYDKGIDGLYIDDLNEEIILLQSKLRQNKDGTLGDTELKEFKGSLSQFTSPASVDTLLAGNANADLKKLLQRTDVKALLQKTYAVRGVFVVNVDADYNAREYLIHNPDITVYDKTRIASEFIDLNMEAGVVGSFSFACRDIPPLEYAAKASARMFLFPALATELTSLAGISDGTVFSQNVRLALGNTKVNKDIENTVQDKGEHAKFPLFHNGVTLVCKQASLADGALTVTNYAVVNGAQSLTALLKKKKFLTADLRILTRVIEIRDDQALARQITTNTNNQNSIKPRDSKSNHVLQTRLKAEFESLYGSAYVYEVKRGEEHDPDDIVILNEEAGKLLLSFDCEEPWSSHQVYKIFDDEYTKIFARPEVDAKRIVFLHRTMALIHNRLHLFKNKTLGFYSITRFFLLYVLKRILQSSAVGQSVIRDPGPIVSDSGKMAAYEKIVSELLDGIIIDTDFEFSSDPNADYKSDLKSPVKASAIATNVVRTYEKDVARGKAIAVEALQAAL